METQDNNNNNNFGIEVITFGYEPGVYKSPMGIPIDILRWGRNNLAPEEYLYLYYNSTTHSGIINKKAQATTGSGFLFSNPQAELFAIDIEFDSLFSQVALDYWLYNNIGIQVITKKYGKTIHSIKYQDVSMMRKTTDDNKYAICGNWTSQQDTALQIYEPQEILYVNKFNEGSSAVKGGFIFKSFNQPGVEYYSYPEYFAAINSIKSEIDLNIQQQAFINNNFALTSIIKLPSTVSKQQVAQFKEEMKKQMTGVTNHGKMLVVNSDGEHSVEVIPISVPMDFSGIEKGLDICTKNIIRGHALPSPMIAGDPSTGGLGNDGTALDIATDVWMKQQIIPVRKKLLKIFENLFELAGYPGEITIVDEEASNKTKADTNTNNTTDKNNNN